MEELKIGDIKEFDGLKRIVTGFSVINGIKYPNTKPYKEEIKEELEEEFTCQYCGRVCGSNVGLASHEKACKENPENKGGEK